MAKNQPRRFLEILIAKALPGTTAAIRAALTPGESVGAFVRWAVEQELRRRKGDG